MTNAELNTFLDLEWNCAAFTPEETSVSAPLSPTQWARILSRHPELQEFCPFAEFTPADWVVVLEKQLPFAWHCSCWKDFTPHLHKSSALYRVGGVGHSVCQVFPDSLRVFSRFF